MRNKGERREEAEIKPAGFWGCIGASGSGGCGRDVIEDLKPWKGLGKVLYNNGISFGIQGYLKEHGLVTIFMP